MRYPSFDTLTCLITQRTPPIRYPTAHHRQPISVLEGMFFRCGEERIEPVFGEWSLVKTLRREVKGVACCLGWGVPAVDYGLDVSLLRNAAFWCLGRFVPWRVEEG